MKPLPDNYVPLTQEERVQQEEFLRRLEVEREAIRARRKHQKETVPHQGDKRSCPACELGL